MEIVYLNIISLVLTVPSIYSQEIYRNLSYGGDLEQIMDLYQPKNKISKAIMLVHGGAWVTGSKTDVELYFQFLRQQFPEYAVANLDYRLGTKDSPGFPKQIEDMDLAVKFLRSKVGRDVTFAFFGGSAGAHLSMLYSYGFDHDKVVKVVVNVVGPADLTAWDYASNFIYNSIFMALVGPYFYWDRPGIYYVSSPVAWINVTSPKTISFYGNKDPVVPLEQGYLLKKRLDQAGIINEFSLYPGGHADWAEPYQQDLRNKTVKFLRKYF